MAMMRLLALVAFLPLLASAGTWRGFWYDLGVFGAHPTLSFKSFDIKAPELHIARWDPRCEDGYALLSPRGRFYPEPGPLIYDHSGELIWIERQYGMVMDLNVQRYKDQDYLTFWVGHDDGTRGEGSYYMLNSSYEVAHIVSAANGLKGDVHEFKITDQGTALMSIYEICQMDLTSVGRGPDGWVYDGLFQEIDIETGELLFEWRARDHYAANDSYFDVGDKSAAAPTAFDAYDYFHINSIDKKSDGTYLISSRYMHSITCISPTGDILWILGGKRNMFKDLSGGAATDFTWQHDARWYSDNVITLLDNGANEHSRTSDHSRGMMISLDFENWTATAIHIYDSPGRFSSHSQGNLQVMPKTGNIFIGWGKASSYTEFSLDGELLCDTHFGPSMFYWFGWVKTYRVQKKANWIGKPSYPPSIAVEKRTVYVSWNGATEIAGWVLQRATNPHAQDSEFRSLCYFLKTGFETKFTIPGDVSGFLRVAAVDANEEELGYTRVFEGDSGQIVSSMLLPPSTLDDRNIQEFLLAACMMAGIVLALWKSRSSLPLIYLRVRRLVRRYLRV